MPKLLQINVTQNLGSTGKIAEQIGKIALDNGWESYIAWGRGENSSVSKSIKIGNKAITFFHVLFKHILDADGLGSIMATKHLIRKIDRISPDIIHLHVLHQGYINYPLLFKYLKSLALPVIWTFHDCWAFTGHCYYFDYIGCNKWKTKCNKCPVPKNLCKLELILNSSRNLARKKQSFSSVPNLTIVPVSNWLQRQVKESLFKDYNITVIHNGIDINVFKPLNFEGNKNNLDCPKIILGVANVWNERKGFKDFMEIARRNPDWSFIIIGVTKNQLKDLSHNIRGILFTKNQDELAEYYNMANVFINPTYEDTYPTVNLESIACGTPVVTYNTGGSPEAITEETGLVAEKGNIDDLETKIKYVLNKGKSYYSPKCRKYALDHFDMYDCFRAYLNLYNELLS